MAGGGKIRIQSGRSQQELADVIARRLQVDAVIGGGGATQDINIAEVGGNVVPGSSVPINDAGGSLTIDGTVAVSNFPASQAVNDGGGSISIDDGGNIITVNGTVSTNQLTDASLLSQQGGVAALFKGRPPLFERIADPTLVAADDNEWSQGRVDEFGALWVRIIDVSEVLSGSNKGQPITVTTVSTNLHSVPVDELHIVTLWACNPSSTTDLTLTVEWGTTTASQNLKFFIPCGQTVLVMNETPLENELTISAKTNAGTANIVGKARRGGGTQPPP